MTYTLCILLGIAIGLWSALAILHLNAIKWRT
jgi:hypothetical protein